MPFPAPKPQSVTACHVGCGGYHASQLVCINSLLTGSFSAEASVSSCGNKQDTRLPTPKARAQACSRAQQKPDPSAQLEGRSVLQVSNLVVLSMLGCVEHVLTEFILDDIQGLKRKIGVLERWLNS